MVISVTPEPPAHMAIFDNYQRIYANPYILYKYGYLKEAPRLFGVVCGDPGGAKGRKHPEFQWRFSMTKEGPCRKLTAKEKNFDVIQPC